MDKKRRVEFVSYDGNWPNLCSGTLILKIDGKEVTFPPYCMKSGGAAYFAGGWDNDVVEHGDWEIDIPERYEYLREEIEEVVNENVPQGCCGGCL